MCVCAAVCTMYNVSVCVMCACVRTCVRACCASCACNVCICLHQSLLVGFFCVSLY